MNTIETLDDVARGLAALRSLDPGLEAVILAAGDVPLRRREATLKNLVRIVVGQQVSVQSAAAIFGRLEAVIPLNDAGAICQASDEDFRTAGLSRPKVKTVRAIGLAARDGNLDCAALAEKPLDETYGTLIAIHGVGPWTAEIFALFCLGHPDIFPAGDIALQVAVKDAFKLDERPDRSALASFAEKWAPYRGVAARLFWAYYAVQNKRKSALPA
ncbi:MAG: DNA-3-methyladenine glycosylase 2 family protein [Pseudomonadota bacterium]